MAATKKASDKKKKAPAKKTGSAKTTAAAKPIKLGGVPTKGGN